MPTHDGEIHKAIGSLEARVDDFCNRMDRHEVQVTRTHDAVLAIDKKLDAAHVTMQSRLDGHERAIKAVNGRMVRVGGIMGTLGFAGAWIIDHLAVFREFLRNGH